MACSRAWQLDDTLQLRVHRDKLPGSDQAVESIS